MILTLFDIFKKYFQFIAAESKSKCLSFTKIVKPLLQILNNFHAKHFPLQCTKENFAFFFHSVQSTTLFLARSTGLRITFTYGIIPKVEKKPRPFLDLSIGESGDKVSPKKSKLSWILCGFSRSHEYIWGSTFISELSLGDLRFLFAYLLESQHDFARRRSRRISFPGQLCSPQSQRWL